MQSAQQDSGRILPITIGGCKRCTGAMFPDSDGGQNCINCGWSPPPASIPKFVAERPAHRGKEKPIVG